MKRVYLAGPITGLTYGNCTDWREYAQKELAVAGITGVSPLRAKNYLKAYGGKLIGNEYFDKVLSCAKGITTRDRWDAMNSDLLLVNFLGAERASLGSMIEYGWADAARNPIITVMEEGGNLHDHAMVRELTGFRVETLDEGLNVAKAILTY